MLTGQPKPERVERGQVWMVKGDPHTILVIIGEEDIDGCRYVWSTAGGESVSETAFLGEPTWCHLGTLDPALMPEE